MGDRRGDAVGVSPAGLQVFPEERGQLVKRDEVDAVIEIDVAGAGHDPPSPAPLIASERRGLALALDIPGKRQPDIRAQSSAMSLPAAPLPIRPSMHSGKRRTSHTVSFSWFDTRSFAMGAAPSSSNTVVSIALHPSAFDGVSGSHTLS
jgi:hypothetical protein